MVLLFFIQKIPRLGIFVVMFIDILRTFAEFFVVFAFFIFGFSLSFTILLGNQVIILFLVLIFTKVNFFMNTKSISYQAKLSLLGASFSFFFLCYYDDIIF